MNNAIYSLIILLGIISCTIVPSDITSSNKVIEAGWLKNTTYMTTRPIFLIYDELNKRHYISRSNADHLPKIIGHQCGSTSLPRSINEYLNNPGNWRHIIK